MTTTRRKPPGAGTASTLDINTPELLADQRTRLLATSFDGFWRFDADARLLDVNEAYCRMSGYTRDELLNLRIHDLEAVETPREVSEHIGRIRRTGFDRFETKHRRKNGEVYDVEISVSYWKATGQFLLFARDITRRTQGIAELTRHRANLEQMVRERTALLEGANALLEQEIAEREEVEAALRRTEAENRNLIKHAPTAIYEIDFSGPRFTSVNDVMCELSGYTREELFAMNPFHLMDEEGRTRFADRVRKAAIGEPLDDTVEYRGKRKNGEPFWAVLYINFKHQDGKITGALVVAHDITERKRAEAEIESLARFPDENPSPVLRVRRDGQILYANAASQPLLRSDCLSIDGSVPPNIREVVEHAFVSQTTTTIDRECGGRVYSFLVAPVPEIGYANLYGRDVTERMQAVDALRESEEKARQRAEELEGLLNVLPTAVWISLDPKCDVIVGNEAANRFYEAYEGENVSANPGEPGAVRRFFHDGKELTAEELPMQKAAATGRPVLDDDLEVLMPSGKSLNMFGHAIPLFDAKERVRGSMAVFVDITERKQAEEQARLQAAALQAAANGIVITDCEGTIQWVNDAFTRLTGYGAAEAIGKNPRILKSGHQDAKFYKNLWDTILSGRVWQGEVVNKRKDGRLYNEEMTITPVRDVGGAISRFVAIKQDITERKRAEAELTRATERMQSLLSANVIGIAEFDATKIVSANRAFLDMTGYSARDVVRGKVDWREITPPEYAERDNRAWREMIERGECLPYEKEYLTRDGRRLPVLISGVRLTEDPVTGVFLNLDITDWKLMERELQETTHFAEHLFDSRLIGLTRFVEESLVDANDAFLEIVGFTRDDLEAQLIDVRKITPVEYAALDAGAISEMLDVGEAASYEKEYIRKDGSRVPVLIGRKLIRRSPLEWVAFVVDISERKRIQDDLERVRTEFLGEISHELKTPLTAIKGCASMALSSSTPPTQSEARELFEVVDTQANRLTDLVGNLLDMTRIEGGRLSIEPAEVELARIIDEARVIFEHSRDPHALKVDLPPRLPRIRADSRRVVQVLANLYSNAAKFSPSDAFIRVTAETTDKEVVVHVKDRGAGIPPDKMPLLFQKFVQIHTVGAKGTGLGLFICKGIIEAQGGRIWAESAGEGQGATFSFALPIAAPSKRTATRSARQKRRPAAIAARGRRVVAIDDEPQILRYVGHCLAGAGYDVTSTTDPLEAARLVKSKKPDIVLLDMRLPGTSGLAVLEKIRGFSDVPVVFITATANREDVLRGRQFGGTTWLEKPFSPEQLLEHVKGILGQRRGRKRRSLTPLSAP